MKKNDLKLHKNIEGGVFMQQLKMRIIIKDYSEPKLPEGFSLRVADDDSLSDRQAWLYICKNGLLSEDASINAYESTLIKHVGYKKGDTFFVVNNSTNKAVATITLICIKPGEGYVHMVAALPETRGIGIGNFLSAFAVYRLGCVGGTNAWLTTDDFRVPAIKCYLKCGFRPENSDYDMEERWVAWLKKYGYNDVEFLDSKGTVIKYLNKVSE